MISATSLGVLANTLVEDGLYVPRRWNVTWTVTSVVDHTKVNDISPFRIGQSLITDVTILVAQVHEKLEEYFNNLNMLLDFTSAERDLVIRGGLSNSSSIS